MEPITKQKKIGYFIASLLIGAALPYAIGAGLYVAQGNTLHNFNYAMGIYYSRVLLFLQLGLAANIGLFFLGMQRVNIYLVRGFAIGTLVWALWIFWAEIYKV